MNLCILGPSDSGKSYLAKALGIVACNDYKVEYHHCEVLLEQLVALKAVDYMKYQKRLKKICGAGLLILDDFLLHIIDTNLIWGLNITVLGYCSVSKKRITGIVFVSIASFFLVMAAISKTFSSISSNGFVSFIHNLSSVNSFILGLAVFLTE